MCHGQTVLLGVDRSGCSPLTRGFEPAMNLILNTT